jgi:hypothetical protein
VHRDVIQADAAVGVCGKKATETIAVSMKTLPGLPSFAAMTEKIRWLKLSYAARITGLGVSGETKFVVQTILAVSVAFVDVLGALLSNRGLVFGLQHRPALLMSRQVRRREG